MYLPPHDQSNELNIANPEPGFRRTAMDLLTEVGHQPPVIASSDEGNPDRANLISFEHARRRLRPRPKPETFPREIDPLYRDSRNMRLLMREFLPSVIGEYPMKDVFGGVRLVDHKVELILDERPDFFPPDGTSVSTIQLKVPGYGGGLDVDACIVDPAGRRHMLYGLAPWVDPLWGDLWFASRRPKPRRRMDLHAVQLGSDMTLHDRVPAEDMSSWHNGCNLADEAVARWHAVREIA